MKKPVVCLLLCVMIFASCGKSEEAFASVPAAELSGALSPLLVNSAKLAAVDDDYVKFMLEIDLETVEEYVLLQQNSGTEIDQYGIFKVKEDGDTQAISDKITAYLDAMLSNFDNFNYMPGERVKLADARVEVIGDYVIYTVLSADESDAVFEKMDEMIRMK